MALIIGLDIAAPGFSRAAAKQAVRVIGPLATRAAPAVARFNPAATGAALGLGALATPPGQELLEMAEDRGRRDRIALNNAIAQLTQVTLPKAIKRKQTKFNKAVSAGLKVVKASTSYGKKGVINSPKKAFSVVTKTASRINKGGKVAASGIKRKIGLSIRRILK